MNAEEIVESGGTTDADPSDEKPASDGAREISAKAKPTKSRFSELLKAVEHWVQTR
ncbi:MAG: hypothetical protein ACXWKG_13050 [Limisphaerales bacterium]